MASPTNTRATLRLLTLALAGAAAYVALSALDSPAHADELPPTVVDAVTDAITDVVATVDALPKVADVVPAPAPPPEPAPTQPPPVTDTPADVVTIPDQLVPPAVNLPELPAPPLVPAPVAEPPAVVTPPTTTVTPPPVSTPVVGVPPVVVTPPVAPVLPAEPPRPALPVLGPVAAVVELRQSDPADPRLLLPVTLCRDHLAAAPAVAGPDLAPQLAPTATEPRFQPGPQPAPAGPDDGAVDYVAVPATPAAAAAHPTGDTLTGRWRPADPQGTAVIVGDRRASSRAVVPPVPSG